MPRTLCPRPPLAPAVLLALAAPRPAPAADPTAPDRCSSFVIDRNWPVKGGVALLGDGLYVIVNAERNELRLPATPGRSGATSKETTWLGRPRSEREVVLIVGGRVLTSTDLPPDFDLSKAVLVSFEADKVRFFDFSQARGGYYPRGKAR